jgi:transcriptional regulator with XRE-family HTH domain
MATLVQQSIFDHCEAKNISVSALSKQIGISANQLSVLARGEDVPSVYNLQRLARFFGWGPIALGKYVLECKATPTGPKKLRITRERRK